MRRAALITGASSGFGREFAKIFAREGYNLVLVSRSLDKLSGIKKRLETMYGVQVEVFAKDLTEENAAKQVFDFTQEKGIAVDVLVNDAGFGDFGAFAFSNLQKQRDMVQLNVIAYMELTHYFVKPMIKRGWGRIINVASTAAFQPGPLMSVYYATKAFVLSFTEAVSVELKYTGVKVCALCPGPSMTDFGQTACLATSGLFKNLKCTAPDTVAEYGYRAMVKNKTVAIPGMINKLIAFSTRLTPRSVVRTCVYHIQK